MIVTVIAASWLFVSFLALVFQPQLVYFPSKPLVALPSQIGLAYESVDLTASDGVKLHGWYLPATQARGTLLYLHGNGGNISHRLLALQVMQRLHLNTLIIDYRGYGQSTGRPSEDGTYRDAEAAWRYLTDIRHIPARQVVFYGESLGGAVATWLATRHTPAGLILESAFTSIYDMAHRHYPYLPARLLVRIRYPTLERIGKLSCPVLIVHSRSDEIVPIEQGERLFAAVRAPKQWVERQGRHNEMFTVPDPPLMMGLQQFIDSVLGAGQ